MLCKLMIDSFFLVLFWSFTFEWSVEEVTKVYG